MVSRCIVAFLAVLAVVYADDQPCSKQIEAELQCMITLKTGAEAKKLKDAVKQIHKTCVPDMPESCHAEMEAVHECTTDLAKNIDSNANLKDKKKEAESAVDECYTKHPPNVFKAFEEIFMPKHHMGGHFGKFRKFRHHKKHHGGKGNDTMSSSEQSSSEQSSGEKKSGESSSAEGSSSNETFSGERKHHGGKGGHRGRGCRHGRRHGGWGGKNATSASGSASSSKENNTSSEGSGEKKHHKKHHEKPECKKTKEQKKCVFHEFKKLGNDTALVETINTIVNQKRKCKQLVTWSCGDKSPFREFCLFKKTKSFRQAFVQELESCVEKKGFTLPPFMLRTGGDASKILEATSPLPPVAST